MCEEQSGRSSPVERFFLRLIALRYVIIPVLLLIPAVFLTQLFNLEKDVRSDAFIADNNPALIYRDVIKERFGLEDPMLVAIVAEGDEGIYTAETLGAIRNFTDALNTVPNVAADQTVGMTTVSTIEGTFDGLLVSPVLEDVPGTAEAIAALRARVAAFPLFDGSLVSKDGAATLIVVQLIDGRLSEATYRDLLRLVGQYEFPPGVTAHIAGEGAVTGYLGAYVDADAAVLNPLAAIIILGIIAFAFRRGVPPLLSLFMICAAISVALGAMSMLQIPFYIVTNALPVILIGIAVADTIHVCSHFFLQQTIDASRDRSELIVETMAALWRPISITSVTTIAGFLGLYFASDMPPFKYFGLFTALGVLVAWVYSILALPCLLHMTQAQVHPSKVERYRRGEVGPFSALMTHVGRICTSNPRKTLLAYLVIAAAGVMGASQLKVDDDRLSIFHPDEKISLANEAIQKHIGGTGTLDVVVETSEMEGILDPEVLRRISQVQAFGESLEGVSGSRSIVDYLKQMNSVLSDDEAYAVPDSSELAAQYLLLYGFSGDPADFSQLVDYDYQTANIRFAITPGDYQSFKPIVEALDAYQAQLFAGKATTALSGRVSLDYHWLQAIEGSHKTSLLGALLMVFLVSSFSFRSARKGVLSLVPVLASVLSVYAVMAIADIPLGVGTSMFAAVAIGLGIDFSIHTISALSRSHEESRVDMSGQERAAALVPEGTFFVGTGQALLLNFLAVASGFAVLMVSEVSPLADFGRIVLTAMAVSFIASVTLLPAWYVLRANRIPGA
ncbi:MAG: RND family transporter [Congregibacter sp.]